VNTQDGHDRGRLGGVDSYSREWEASLKKRIRTILQDASAEVQAAARTGRCWRPAEKKVKLAKYADWPGNEIARPLVVHRYCALWGRGA